ncbi:3 beta-hydroxysteroid dehydrogenase/Delta 5--_4-isomerase [Rubripirellula amarantea]|uniref:3 beta-hydroxysteroid dehydrogenase/Delta 5-->4-isomerase n=1 Tax=Rubripirellula amarantea TaxID=2527999 RepID=A0A5C5WBU4_9BACT|nr:SDR family oxidoreductase [Rubripirellula amarantea]TWT48114.1 3 beta-hydroxysteroid dehydrogenase/Delta 5-->4-isomerase [Rubripirellula amarantea]
MTESPSTPNPPLILLTGATGYVGGRLKRLLEESGHRLRCMARRPENLSDRIGQQTDVVFGDVLDRDSLDAPMQGVHTAYYLIHSMGVGDDFESDDRKAAMNFAHAAKQAGVKRIIYLGGLGADDDDLSLHLRSRHEVGKVLQQSGAQVIEFRASIIIGSGSLSFDLVRSLVRKLPVMVWPKWVSTEASPIAIRDVLAYLTEVLEHPIGDNKVYEIGGPETVSYGGIMEEYARQRGLRRLKIRVPFLSPRISSLWLGLVTPVYARIGRKLVEGLANPTVVTNEAAIEDFTVRPCDVKQAIARAIEKEDQEMVETRWSDALSSSGRVTRWGGVTFGSRVVDSRTETVHLAAEQAFEPIARIGGSTGWYYGNWLWMVRGFMDQLVGGVGLRRGRRHPTDLRVGEAVDFWRVEHLEPGRRLRLFAEMKLPGRAWLDFEVTEKQPGQSVIRQTAEFDPIGIMGLAYWYAVWPLHQFVFSGMLRNIARAAERLASKNHA